MEYKDLAKIYHMDGTSHRESSIQAEYERRYNADSTFRLDFDTPYGSLFVAVPRELTVLSERILRTERKISNIVHNLPGVANRAVLRGLVMDEVVCTNAIEEIRSSMEQVRDALEATDEAPANQKRFRELAMLYISIMEGTAVLPGTPEEVRAIYDDVTRGEIPDGKLPDGRLFRTKGVNVVQGGAYVIHSGLEPEDKIIEAIEKMLAVLSSFEVPSLYRGIIAHYMFEYIHPFYDGNGRTGRYLLSLALSESLSSVTALSLSRIIAQNREDYYKAFKTTENPMNRGELTFFVYAMLELIRQAQLQLEEKLEKNEAALENMKKAMAEIVAEGELRDTEMQIVYMLMQYGEFDVFGSAPLHDIAAHVNLGDQMTRKYLSSLEKEGIVYRVSKRNPVSFRLTPEFKAKYGL